MKDKQKSEKNVSALDKIVMGLIVGGAIGSALGLSLAPDKGSETREKLKETGKVSWKLGKAVYEVLKRRAKKIIDDKKF